MSTFSNQANAIETWIRDTSPATNFNANDFFYVGVYSTSDKDRGLIKWDLSSIPSNATIISATLSLYVYLDESGNERIMSAYRVKRAWTETGVTWNTYDGSNNWGTAGCANTTSDREATNIGTATIPASPEVDSEIQITLDAASVQEWIDGTLTNNGLLLQVATESNDHIGYHAHTNATPTIRPKLVIEYTAPEVQGGASFADYLEV